MRSAAAGFPHPVLPLELTRASLQYLDVSTLLSLASTSKLGLALLDGESGLWKGWADRRMLYFGAPESNLTSSSSSSSAIRIPSASSTSFLATTEGGPHPFAAVFPDGEGLDGIDFFGPQCRINVAAFNELRAKAIETHLAPLLDNVGGRGEGGKTQPCLISTYFQAFDVLVSLRADDAIDAILQAQRRRLFLAFSSPSCLTPQFSHSSPSTTSTSFLSPLAVLLALHLLYRSLPPPSLPLSSPSPLCCAWRRRLLSFLAGGPFQGLAVIAFWTMGSHNPQNGFRARDVLKTEKLDVRRVASLLVQGGTKGGTEGGIEETEGGREEVAVERAFAKLESLRGMMPTVTLSPAVVYVGGVEDDHTMCVNAQGYFALSSSPPRR